MHEAPKRIIRNTLTNAAGFVFMFVSNILLVPYVIHSLGTDAYGSIWVVIGALTAYIGLLDLGTTTAFVKYIAEFHTKGQEQDILESVNSGMALYLLLSSVIAALVLTFEGTLLRFAGVPETMMNDALHVLRISVAIFVLVGVSSPVTAILSALQRMGTVFVVTLVAQCITIGGTVLMLSNGQGVRGLILVNASVAVVNVLLYSILAKRALPFLTLGFQYVRWAKCRLFLTYGLNIQVSKFGQIIMFQTDRILTLKFFGSFTITQYDVSARLTNAGRSITGVLITSLVPAISSIDASNNTRQLNELYLRGTKYLILVASCFFVYISVFADRIITVWIGPEFVAAALYVRLLSMGYFFNIITGIASSITAGMGRTDLDRNFGILVSISNIILVLGGAVYLGPAGIALGSSVSFILSGIYFFASFNRIIGMRSSVIYGMLLKPLAVSIITALGIEAAMNAIGTGPSRGEQLWTLGCSSIIYGTFYLLLMYRTGMFDAYDRTIYISLRDKVRTLIGPRSA